MTLQAADADDQAIDTAQERDWDREYECIQAIPSSTRGTPSKALLLFDQLLPYGELLTALDVGCGNGRNAVYLAQRGYRVHALDFSQAAVRETSRVAQAAGLGERVNVLRHSLDRGIPFESGTIDLAIDSYVFCHFLDPDFKDAYRRELNRVLRPGGLLYCSVFTAGDEYYAELLNDRDTHANIVVDPRNGIAKQLYTAEGLTSFFAGFFRTLYLTTFRFDDVVAGRLFRRETIAVVLTNDSDRVYTQV